MTDGLPVKGEGISQHKLVRCQGSEQGVSRKRV